MKTFYVVMCEFYDCGKILFCSANRYGNKKPNNQYREKPGLSAFKIWFANESDANELINGLKSDRYDFYEVHDFYSGLRNIEGVAA